MLYFLILCAVLLIACVIGRSCYEHKHLRKKRYVLQAKEKEGVRIVFLSDLHENSFGKENEKLVLAIREETPDLIVLAGDLIIGKGKRVKTEHALAFLKQIQGICPIIYTYGNHETRVKNTAQFQKYKQEFRCLNIHVLNNEGLLWNIKGRFFYFYGLELEPEYFKGKVFSGEVNPFENVEEKITKVLIAHTPNFFEVYAEWGPDYVLSGHNHGGIVRLPALGGLISTEHKFLPKYSYGSYEIGKTKMILSGGAGSHTIPFRLFNPVEMITLEL